MKNPNCGKQLRFRFQHAIAGKKNSFCYSWCTLQQKKTKGC